MTTDVSQRIRNQCLCLQLVQGSGKDTLSRIDSDSGRGRGRYDQYESYLRPSPTQTGSGTPARATGTSAPSCLVYPEADTTKRYQSTK